MRKPENMGEIQVIQYNVWDIEKNELRFPRSMTAVFPSDYSLKEIEYALCKEWEIDINEETLENKYFKGIITTDEKQYIIIQDIEGDARYYE